MVIKIKNNCSVESKLELKHLAAYLPHNLQLLFEKSGRIITMMSCFNDGFLHIVDYNEGNDYDLRVWNFKPLLHPLSDLTKEIEVNGEKFVPRKHFESMGGSYFEYERFFKIFDKGNVTNLSYNQVNKLLEWKFDIFGLIEKGLAIAVTEEFNPYK